MNRLFQFFESLLEPFPTEPPEQAPSTLFAFCRHFTRGAEKYLLVMAFFAGLIGVFEALLFWFLGQLVDWLSMYDPAVFLEKEGDSLLFWALFFGLGAPLIALIYSLFSRQTLLGNYPMMIRWQAHRYLLAQGLAFYQDEQAGRIATKLMQTSLAVRETVMKVLDLMVYVVVFMLTLATIIMAADVRLILPIALWLAAYFGLLRHFLPRLKKVSTEQADARSIMTGRVVDSYTNIMTVKLFSHARRESDYAKEGMQLFLHTVYPQMRLVTGLETGLWIINILMIIGTVAMAIGLWTHELIGLGAIAIALALALRLNGMSHWIMWETASLFENIGTVADGMATLSLPHVIKDVPDAQVLNVTRGDLQLNHLHFAYNDSKAVFDDLNIHIRPGERVGIVGRSGAGKSSLVNLLLRIFDLNGGSIMIDGQDISRVTQESLRAHIGMVTQDTSLLHRSVRENILFGRPDAHDDELLEAAHQAEAHAFILELRDAAGRSGYEAHVGERGVKLSGGQRQRIAIARVLLKNAPILILDEATSALDSEVETAIQESLKSLIEGKTVIAIAHRLSTLAAMDRLIVLDEGRIVEEGRHSELVDAGGLYAQLWAHQSGGFIGDA